jgi:transposase-like protein
MYRQINFFQFQKMFSTELKCWKYLVKKRWPHGFICPRCGRQRAYYLAHRNLFQCQGCHYQTSVTANTIFHKTRTPLKKWFWAIYLVATHKNGIAARHIHRQLNIRFKTAWTMVHKIRQAMKKGNEQYLLKGLIEMDDSYFGGRAVSGKVGRGSGHKRIVLTAVEVPDNKKPRFAALKTLQDLSAKELESCLHKLVDPHQIVKTDGYSSYKILPNIGHFHYPKVLKEKSIIQEHLPWVHILISNVKNALRATFHGVSAKHLQRYLDEFTYRFNRRFSDSNIFDQLLTTCVYSKTITFAELRE